MSRRETRRVWPSAGCAWGRRGRRPGELFVTCREGRSWREEGVKGGRRRGRVRKVGVGKRERCREKGKEKKTKGKPLKLCHRRRAVIVRRFFSGSDMDPTRLFTLSEPLIPSRIEKSNASIRAGRAPGPTTVVLRVARREMPGLWLPNSLLLFAKSSTKPKTFNPVPLFGPASTWVAASSYYYLHASSPLCPTSYEETQCCSYWQRVKGHRRGKREQEPSCGKRGGGDSEEPCRGGDSRLSRLEKT